jgi:hypothetical protein
MIPTPGQPDKYYGIGVVNYYTGETAVQFHLRKRRKEIAQLLEALVEKLPTGTIYVAWDYASTRENGEAEAVVRAAAGRLVLLSLHRRTARGSIPSKCCGDIFVGKQPTANSLRRNRHCWQRPKTASTVSTIHREVCCIQ